MSEVVIAPTGGANLASVRAAFRRLGAECALAEKADDIASARLAMLPGVGAFGPAMARLEAHGLAGALRERFERDAPTMAICVGLQVLFESSQESPGAKGLALASGHARHFPEGARAPQFGWSLVSADEDALLLESGHAYFANSYRIEEAPSGWRCAWAEHGGRYLAAMERGRWIACQFHPELSSAYGAALLSRFLELGQC